MPVRVSIVSALVAFAATSAFGQSLDSTKALPGYYPGLEFKASDGDVLIEDGDSFWLGPHRVRLMGIDTPEPNQKCENQKTSADCQSLTMAFVKPIFNHPQLVCKAHMGKYDKPLMDGGRYLSTCFLKDTEVNKMLVRYGYAVAYTPKTSPVYIEAESDARDRKVGLHKYKFDLPIAFRAARSQSKPCIPTPK